MPPVPAPVKCSFAMTESDKNSDGYLTEEEYLKFIQEFGCDLTTTLSSEQRSIFQALACACLNDPSEAPNCCLQGHATVNIGGAQYTAQDPNFLVEVCSRTEATFRDECVASPIISALQWCFRAIINVGAIVAVTLMCIRLGIIVLHRLVTISKTARQQLQLDTSEMRERAAAELMGQPEVGVTVTALRELVMSTYLLEGVDLARHRHLVKNVWPRVEKEVQQDNRTRNLIVRVD